MAPSSRPRSTHSMMRRFLIGGAATLTGGGSTLTGTLGERATALPHFRQNWASSGRVAPHLLQPTRTLVADDVVLSVGILTGSPLQKTAVLPEKFGGRANYWGYYSLDEPI